VGTTRNRAGSSAIHRAHDEAAVGHDAGDLALADDDEDPDVAVAHLRGRGGQRVRLGDRPRIGGHHLVDGACHRGFATPVPG